MKKKSVYYWSPFLTPIATCKAVINSAYCINKFSKKFDAKIINFYGEFDKNIKDIENKNIDTIRFYNNNFLNFFPKYGKIFSRISFIFFFILGFFPLIKLLKTNKPNYLIIHLITSLPLILLILFNFETKFILRISGLPKLNIFRKFLWKIALKKTFLITCPTKETYNYIKSLKLCNEEKIKILFDPVINVNEIKNKIKQDVNLEDNSFYVAIGRLTNQKNFLFLCKCFKELKKKNPEIKLYIIGDGEEFYLINNYINKEKLLKNIKLVGHKQNIFPYFKRASGFILSSLWEDPGFVLIEAGFCRIPVFSTDAKPGPYEIIKDNINGTNFISNDIRSFIDKFDIFLKNSKNKKILLRNFKLSRKFTVFNHYKKLSHYLN